MIAVALLYALTGGVSGAFGGMMGQSLKTRFKWAFVAWVVLTTALLVLHLAAIGVLEVIA